MIDPLWRRAPTMLRSYPAAAAALVLAALVLAAVASSGPAFLASAGDAALRDELDRQPGQRTGVSLSVTGISDPAELAAVDTAVTGRLGQIPALGDPTITVTSSRVGGFSPPIVADVGGELAEVWLVSRSGAIDTLVPVTVDGAPTTADPGATGVWVLQPWAADLGLVAGADLTLRRGDQVVRVPVAGFYRLPRAEDADGYWTSVGSQLGPRMTINTALVSPTSAVPSPLFTTPEAVAALTGALGGTIDVTWETGLRTAGLTLTSVGAVLDDYAALDGDLADTESPIAQAVVQFHTTKTVIKSRSTLPATVGLARATEAALRPALHTLSLTGTVLGLALVAAAAVVLIRRRSAETRMLDAQGVGVTVRALRSGIETFPALFVGGVLGWALGLAVVAVVPPVLPVARSTVVAAGVTTAWALLAAVVTVVAATAWAAGRPETLVPRRVRSAPVPWEVGLILLAGLAGYELVRRGASSDSGGDLLTLAFPLLLLSGVAALGARLLTSAASGPVRLTERWPFPAYLAARRLAGGAASTRLLVAVVAVATGMAVYGTVLVASTRASLDEKALIANGAPVNAALKAGLEIECSFVPPPSAWQFTVTGEQAFAVCPDWQPAKADATRPVVVTVLPAGLEPSDLPADATLVAIADVRARPDAYSTRLLLVDPTTYARITGATDVAAVVSRPGELTTTTIPGATAGQPFAGPLPAKVGVEIGGTVTKVALTSFEAVPGMAGTGATIVVDASTYLGAAVPQVFGDASDLLKLFDNAAWSTGTEEGLEAALLTLGAPVQSVTTTDDVLRRPDFRAQSWSLAYLQVLAASAAALAIGALLLNLAERQRSRSLASAMVRRMGVTRRSMRLSIALELTALLGAGTVLGLVVGLLAGAFVATGVDPLSGAAPARGVVVPTGLVLVVLASAAVVVVVASLFLARVTERADIARLMRLAD